MMMLQVKGITDAGLKPRKMKKIAVLGGGLMGSGIATASALAGMDVIIKEVNDKFLQVCSLLSVVLWQKRSHCEAHSGICSHPCLACALHPALCGAKLLCLLLVICCVVAAAFTFSTAQAVARSCPSKRVRMNVFGLRADLPRCQ